MALSSVVKTNTPRSNTATPRWLAHRQLLPPSTPECFSTVTVETPLVSKRRSSKYKSDEASNLTVAVRIRPMNARELALVGSVNVVRVEDRNIAVSLNPSSGGNNGVDYLFQYDHVFLSCDERSLSYSNQEDVFDNLGKPLLNNAFRGYNACLFAYGQTGSGKSYSMMGPDASNFESNENAGITPRFCHELFSRIDRLGSACSATVEVSYFEIYNEKIHDLLAANVQRTALKVREHPVWGPYVVDLSMHVVKTYEEMRSWLALGNKNRATAATAMNKNSSRSHSIFSIELSISEVLGENDTARRSKVSLVDLAGSERLGGTSSSDEKLKQGVSINKSLLTLGKVILALAEQKKGNPFVPYRESVLTWLLRESLGGNSRTSMLATITPANTHVDETLATLRYACQARSIVNRARINEDPHDRLIRELRAEVERLRALRQDYERTSSVSVIHIDDSTENVQELEELREKLLITENNLVEAQANWEQRFKETRQQQLQELAEAERRKEELESHVRVMSTVDTNVNLSPYRTNFLEELEAFLDVDDNMNVLNDFKNILSNLELNYELSLSENEAVTVVDKQLGKKAICTISEINSCIEANNHELFINNLKWCLLDNKKSSKPDVSAPMKQIYEALNTIKSATEGDENMRLAFARFSKSFQVFETALAKCRSDVGVKKKTVSFRL